MNDNARDEGLEAADASESHQPMDVDSRALRGLAHPLRARILDELSFNGPATATILGRRLGESSGSTSYHLRQLSRYGFIEAGTGSTGGRERWWQVRRGGWSVRGREFLRDPETRQTAEVVLGRYFRGRSERFARWIDLTRTSPGSPALERWSRAASDSVGHVRMTPEETEELAGALNEFVRTQAERFQGRTPESHPDTESVELQTNLFPNLPEASQKGEGQSAPEGG